MSDELVQKLAIAYAQVKLVQEQQQHPEKSGYDEEVRFFLKQYNYACHQIHDQSNDLDEYF